MSLFEQLLQDDTAKNRARLEAWAEWKATCKPPDPEERDRRGEKPVWLLRPDHNYEAAYEKVELWDFVSATDNSLAVLATRDLLGGFPTQKWSLQQFWMNYYEDVEWEPETQAAFPDFFAQRRAAHCETCPALGKLTMHHKRRSTKECEVSDLLAAFQFKGEGVDERVLMGEMSKGLWICRDCHDKVHKAEKKLKNERAFSDYMKSLQQQFAAWLDVDQIVELAKLSPT